VHRRTVQTWRKQGLGIIDETSRPYLVIGEEIRRFLKEKNRKRKHPLKPGEFYCPRCGIPRKSIPDRISIEITEKRLGKYKQAIIRGRCEICDCRLSRFSSNRKVQELRKNGMTLAKCEKDLVGSADSCLNTDMERGGNGEGQR
jgi:hypothetical protein